MSQQIYTRQLGLFVVMGVGFMFAWFAGNFIADENFAPIAAVLVGLLGLIVIFGLGKSIYLMIPICWILDGKISVLPLPFDFRQIVILTATSLILSDVIFKKKIQSHTYRGIDTLALLNIAYIAVIFLIHPVGVAVIDSGDRVGGRPYLDIIIGIAAYTILSREKPSINFLKNLPFYCLLAALFVGFSGALGTFFPVLGAKLAYIYSGFAPGTLINGILLDQRGSDFGTDRLIFFTSPGLVICLYIVCIINPLQLIRPYNWRFLVLYLFGLIMMMLSGFRNGLINIIFETSFSAILRDRIEGAFKIIAFGVVFALVGIISSYTNINLPYTFQRTLCFLPGKWDEDVLSDARGSTDWRIQMWKEVVRSDKYIQNKIFGDGFGIPREEYEKQINASFTGVKAYDGEFADQEAFMINGDFHSGPLSMVRCIGIMGGCLLFIPFMIANAIYAYRIIKRSEGYPLHTCSLFFGIPTMIYPFFFIFVFGDFKAAMVDSLFNLGMLNMIQAHFNQKNLSSSV